LERQPERRELPAAPGPAGVPVRVPVLVPVLVFDPRPPGLRRREQVSARQLPKMLSGSWLRCTEENWFASDGSALFLR